MIEEAESALTALTTALEEMTQAYLHQQHDLIEARDNIDAARTILIKFAGDDDCSYDGNDFCLPHYWFRPCPHEEARHWLQRTARP